MRIKKNPSATGPAADTFSTESIQRQDTGTNATSEMGLSFAFEMPEKQLIWTVVIFMGLLIVVVILFTVFMCFIRKRYEIWDRRKKRQQGRIMRSFLKQTLDEDVNEDDLLLKKESRPFPTNDIFFNSERLATIPEAATPPASPEPVKPTEKPNVLANLRDSAILFPSLSTLNGSGNESSPRMSVSSRNRDSPDDFSRMAAQFRKQSMRATVPQSPVPQPDSPTFVAAEMYEREYRKRRVDSIRSYPSSLFRSSDGSESERSAY